MFAAPACSVLYDMYFEVANLRLGRGGEKPLE